MNCEVLQCVLCKGMLPAVRDDDDVFLSHMRDQHRVYVNQSFLFSASFLDQEGIKKATNFINLTSGNDVTRVENEDGSKGILETMEELPASKVIKQKKCNKISAIHLTFKTYISYNAL